jgi:tetratricopeptide (TPR) repeat protein
MTTSAFDDRPRLSVAMIVRDAAATLEATLDSVRSIADEMVVFDTGSSDGTVGIALQGADVVEQIEWQESFSSARNECLARVTGDWVLWLEAGETIEDTAAQQIRNFIDESADENKAYLLFVQRPSAAAANSTDQIGQLRLLPNRPELRYTGRVREQILPSVIAANMGLDALDCVIQRPQLDHEPGRQRDIARRMLNLANLGLTEEADQPILLLARAEALAQLGRPTDARQVYRRVIEVAERGSSEMLEGYYGLLTAMDAGYPMGVAAAEDQVTKCLEALQIYPLDAQLLCGMGGYLLRLQRLDLAARSYEVAVNYGKVNPAVWHLADLADVAVSGWSLVLQLLGDTRRAEDVLRDALHERPDSPRLRRQLVELFIKAGREQDALAQCRSFPDDFPDHEQLANCLRVQ